MGSEVRKGRGAVIMEITYETPMSDETLLPPGDYDFEVVGWTQNKQKKPFSAADKTLCFQVDYEIMCSNGVGADGSPIEQSGRIKGTFKLVEKLFWIPQQYFVSIGKRKHRDTHFLPNWTKEGNIGESGRVRIKHRAGTSRNFAEVGVWLDPADEGSSVVDPSV